MERDERNKGIKMESEVLRALKDIAGAIRDELGSQGGIEITMEEGSKIVVSRKVILGVFQAPCDHPECVIDMHYSLLVAGMPMCNISYAEAVRIFGVLGWDAGGLPEPKSKEVMVKGKVQ